jgi:hypothetical protein
MNQRQVPYYPATLVLYTLCLANVWLVGKELAGFSIIESYILPNQSQPPLLNHSEPMGRSLPAH